MANGASVAEGLPMPTQPDEQRAAMTEQRAAMRDVLGPLLNKFGELQWQSGRSLRVSHEDLHDAFEAVISAAALSALPAGGGWKLVPIEPNDDMQLAGAQAVRFDTTPINKIWTANAAYRAMLAAAPQQQENPKCR